MLEESMKGSVMAAMEGSSESTPVAPAESTPAPVSENVSSQEVNTEVTPTVQETIKEVFAPQLAARTEEVQKDAKEEQINNLNKALSIERDEIKKLQAEIGNYKPTFDKLKNAFVPEDVHPVVESPTELSKQDEFEQWYQQKEAAKAEELNAIKLQEMIKTQIDTLSNEWNGEAGKPKYDDNEVYKWQKDNGKEYLTPEEAFMIMKRNDIVDWQARSIASRAQTVVPSERPAGTSTDHSPSRTTPRTDQEIKNAVLEAMNLNG